MTAAPKPESAQEPTPSESPKAALRVAFEKNARLITALLPKGETLDHVIALVALAIQKDDTGKLALCTPGSLVLGAARILSWGLDIGENAYLVPFKHERSGTMRATPVAGYTGLVQLMLGSTIVRAIDAQPVFVNEHFEYEHGLYPKLVHRPIAEPSERGELRGAYCVIRLPFGHVVYEYMALEEIDQIRAKHSKQWSKGPCPPWYAVKTVIRRASKLMPKSPKLAAVTRVLAEDADELSDVEEIEAGTLPTDVTQPRPAPATPSRRSFPMPRAEEVPIPQRPRVSVHSAAPYGETQHDTPSVPAHILNEMRMDDRRFEDDDPYNKPPY